MTNKTLGAMLDTVPVEAKRKKFKSLSTEKTLKKKKT